MHKIAIIYRLLFELATGRTPLVGEQVPVEDAWDALLVSFSKLGMQLQQQQKELGVVSPLYDFQPVAPFVLVLDSGFRIQSCTPAAAQRMGLLPAAISGSLFTDWLDSTSLEGWRDAIVQASLDGTAEKPAGLLLRTSGGQRLPLVCWIIADVLHNSYFLVVVEASLKEAMGLAEYGAQQKGPVEVATNLAAKVRDHILQHLDAPLPSARDLALLFGTDEFLLRKAFRKHYRTSPYQFYQERRLAKALLLIMHAHLPLQEVASRCGFDQYGNFYKAFRKRYGFPPSTVGREA